LEVVLKGADFCLIIEKQLLRLSKKDKKREDFKLKTIKTPLVLPFSVKI